MAKKKRKSLAAVREEVAELLQKLVRLKAANLQGYCQCVTCDKWKLWTEMHGGHFIERGRNATKLVEENIHPQCPGCNNFGMKKTTVVLRYRKYMVDMYGEDFVSELELLSGRPVKHSRAELQAMKEQAAADIDYQLRRIKAGYQPQEAVF